MKYYLDCHMAIDDAMRRCQTVVGHVKGKGWILYCPISMEGYEDGNTVPEIFCLHRSILPIPLTDEGMEIVLSWVNRIFKIGNTI